MRRDELIELMVGRPIASVFPKREVAMGEIALELRNVSSAAAGLRDVSLSVRRGEILGLAGLVGSGRTQVAETIFGLTPADSGEILVRRRICPDSLARQGHSIGYRLCAGGSPRTWRHPGDAYRGQRQPG